MTEELSIVDLISDKKDRMTVTWDLGRRCNFDCTYCPAHRHDNFSRHALESELKKTATFIFEYLALIMPHKTNPEANISFTGGEPTLNPKFIDFSYWLRSEYEKKYKPFFNLGISITSNGAINPSMRDSIIKNYNFITISYHCEAIDRLKKQVVENIKYLHNKIPMKINVMFHAREDYFQECLDLCAQLEKIGVDYVPRMIGEHGDDNDYHHKYTEQQIKWMKDFWENKKEMRSFNLPIIKNDAGKKQAPSFKHQARSLGRPCCSKRKMNTCGAKTTRWKQTEFLNFANFKDWHCSVNWFFLHIEQQEELIFHHQTCQANFDSKKEPIGTIKNFQLVLDNLKENLKKKSMPIIKCPNKICGCGICTPKAKEFKDLNKILTKHINKDIFSNNPLVKKENSLKNRFLRTVENLLK